MNKMQLLYILALLFIPFLSQGREGLVIDPEVIKRVSEWKPKPMGYAGPPSVDLRFNSQGKSIFPNPGRQWLNDCIA